MNLIVTTPENLRTLIAEAVAAALPNHLTQPPPPELTPGKPMTVKQAAEFLSVSEGAIYAAKHRGNIQGFKRGSRLYFMPEEISALLKRDEHISAEQQANDQREAAGRKRNGGR